MSHQEALAAFQDGDFRNAVKLLEQAVEETGYASDPINHAFTLALHRTGEKKQLADAAFRVAEGLAGDDPAAAMDYFQRALVAGLDPERVRRIGELHEQWAEPKPIGHPERPIRKVAHVLGCVSPAYPPTQYVKMLSKALSEQGIESLVFTTEWSASWFTNSEPTPQSQDIGVPCEVASVAGDFNERAETIAAAIRASGAEVAFYHGGFVEQLTVRVAALRPCSIQIHVNHGPEIEADLFDGRIHLSKASLNSSRYRNQPSEWIAVASDIEERLPLQEPVSKQSLGIDAADSVSATFGNLSDVAGQGYLRMLREILKRFPNHFHLFVGAGDVKAVRSALHADGVLPQVRFLGQMGDTTPVLNLVDVYLAAFPTSAAQPIVDAMGAGKPVLALHPMPGSPQCTGSELVAIQGLVAAGEAGYIELADKLIRNESVRQKYAAQVKERFQSEFRPEMLARRYLAYLEKCKTV